MSSHGDRLVQEVKRIAEANPDFVYQRPPGSGCVYVHDGRPSCLIGRALWNLGAIDADFENAVDDRARRVNQFGVMGLLELLGLSLSSDESVLLMTIQDRQDDGLPWGEAVS